MKNFTPILGILLFLGLFLGASVEAHSPVDFLEVIKVDPAQLIEHDVELKTNLDSDRVKSSLKGPVYFSRAVGALGREIKKPLAYLNWFVIANPKTKSSQDVEVLDMVRGSRSKKLRIGPAEYLLSPAQRITTGAPDPIPEGLDLYKAYRILNGTDVGLELQMTDSLGAGERKVGKPLYLCVPTSQWHHDETVTPSHPKDCFVVYELEDQPLEGSFSTIDQFGLNELRAVDQPWISVRAAFLRISTE